MLTTAGGDIALVNSVLLLRTCVVAIKPVQLMYHLILQTLVIFTSVPVNLCYASYC